MVPLMNPMLTVIIYPWQRLLPLLVGANLVGLTLSDLPNHHAHIVGRELEGVLLSILGLSMVTLHYHLLILNVNSKALVAPLRRP